LLGLDEISADDTGCPKKLLENLPQNLPKFAKICQNLPKFALQAKQKAK